MICSCCNLPVNPQRAKRSNYCKVCDQADCTAHRAEHSEALLADHHGENAVEHRTK